MPESTTVARCECVRCRAHDAGKRGPYTPQEFASLVGVVNEPPPVEVPAELVDLALDVDVALEAVDASRQAWEDAVIAYQRAPDDLSYYGRKETAREAMYDARSVLEGDEKRLTAVRSVYQEAQRRITTDAARDEYLETLAAQTAAVAAARAASLARRSPVQRLRTRVGL